MAKDRKTLIIAGMAVIALAGIATYLIVQRRFGAHALPVVTTTNPEVVETSANPSAPAAKPDNYIGNSTKGACQFKFAVKAGGGTLSGMASGPGKDIDCSLNFNGTVDGKGDVNGKADATYSTTISGTPIDWTLSGPVTGKLDDKNGELTIKLEGLKNNCPPKIPCTNPQDEISVMLERE